MKKRVLGVTGLMGSGKDTVCRFLRELGVDEIDVDWVGHIVLREKQEQVRTLFGASVSTARGIDRRELGRVVFSDPGALKQLERLLHPEMVVRVRQRIDGISSPVAINAAVLYTMGLDEQCDGVLRVCAPDSILISRLVSRSGIPPAEAARRLEEQKSVNPELNSSEVVIENACTPEALRDKVRAFAESFFGEGPYGTTAGTKWPQGDVYPQP